MSIYVFLASEVFFPYLSPPRIDYLCCLSEGKIIYFGPAEEVRNQKKGEGNKSKQTKTVNSIFSQFSPFPCLFLFSLRPLNILKKEAGRKCDDYYNPCDLLLILLLKMRRGEPLLIHFIFLSLIRFGNWICKQRKRHRYSHPSLSCFFFQSEKTCWRYLPSFTVHPLKNIPLQCFEIRTF